MRILISLLFTLATAFPAHAQQYVEKQNDSNPQYFKNAGFENFIQGWSVASGTRTYPTSIGDKISGKGFKLAFTSITAGTTLLSQTYSDCADLNGKALLTGIHIKTPSANIEVCSQIDGTDYQCSKVPAGGAKLEWIPATMIAGPFTCGMRVKVANSTTTSDITVDAARLGENPNVGTVAQAVQMGSLTYAGQANCTWERSGTGSDTFGGFSADTDCATPTVTGTASAPGTKIPALVFPSIPPGTLKCYATGAFQRATGSTSIQFAFNDGVTTSGGQIVYNSNAGTLSVPSIHGELEYATSRTNVTVQVYARTANTANPVQISAANSVIPFFISCTHFPPASEQVQNLGQAVDMLGTLLFTERGTCPLGTVEANGGTIPAQYTELIAYIGSTTMPDYRGLYARNIGTSAISGRNKVGPTNPGDKQEDQFQGHRHRSNPNNGNNLGDSVGGANLSTGGGAYGLYSTTGNADVSDGTNGTPRVGAETRVPGYGVRPCMVARRTTLQAAKASVVSRNAGVTVIESATINCNASSTATNKSSDWISIANRSGDGCVLTFSGFTARPKCFLQVQSSPSNTIWGPKLNSVTTGGANYLAPMITSGSSTIASSFDSTSDIFCVGN